MADNKVLSWPSVTRVTYGCLHQPAGIKTLVKTGRHQHNTVERSPRSPWEDKRVYLRFRIKVPRHEPSRPSPSPAKVLGCAPASSRHARSHSLCTISPSSATTRTQRFSGLRELANREPKGTISATLKSGKLPVGTQVIPATWLLPVYKCPDLLTCPTASLWFSQAQASTLPEDTKSSAGQDHFGLGTITSPHHHGDMGQAPIWKESSVLHAPFLLSTGPFQKSRLSLQWQDAPLPQARVCSVLLARLVWFRFLNNAVFYFH